jgi:hypothetical protein
MASIQKSPHFSNFVALKPDLYFNLYIESSIGDAYRAELNVCVVAIYQTTGALPDNGAAISVYQGRPAQIKLLGYGVFDDAVLVTLSCTEIEIRG